MQNKKIYSRVIKMLLNIALVSLFLLTAFSCENSVDPPEDKPGRRDYVWTVDTLFIPEGRTYPFYMWGSATDLWAVGSAYLNAYQIWHFDGNAWSNYIPDKYVDPIGIYGSSSNNIWMGSTDGSLWFYNGVKWSKNFETKIPGYKKFHIGWLSGSDAKNVYAVGFADSIEGNSYKGIIFNYNGTTWKQVDIQSERFWFNAILYNKPTGEYLLQAGNFETPETKVFVFNGSYLKEVYSTMQGLSISRLGDKLYVTEEKKVYRFESGELKQILDLQSASIAGGGIIYGRSEKDFFTGSFDGIAHYNGTDLITVFPKANNDWAPNCTIVFEKDVFSIWRDTMRGYTIVIHGKLKN